MKGRPGSNGHPVAESSQAAIDYFVARIPEHFTSPEIGIEDFIAPRVDHENCVVRMLKYLAKTLFAPLQIIPPPAWLTLFPMDRVSFSGAPSPTLYQDLKAQDKISPVRCRLKASTIKQISVQEHTFPERVHY